MLVFEFGVSITTNKEYHNDLSAVYKSDASSVIQSFTTS